jgi:hypothetical protein
MLSITIEKEDFEVNCLYKTRWDSYRQLTSKSSFSKILLVLSLNPVTKAHSN